VRTEESKKEYRDIVKKTFTSEDDGYQFYNRYALEKGFSVRRNYVEWDGANKEIVLRKLEFLQYYSLLLSVMYYYLLSSLN
jgi:zinc finger SWIM domain-containing protein 3